MSREDNTQLSDRIEDGEALFRRILNKPNMWKEDQNRPTSAIFKTSRDNAVSVDRDGGRSVEQIESDMLKDYRDNGLCYIKASKCREIGVKPEADPLENNIYHAVILNSDGSYSLDKKAARKLAKNAVVVLQPLNTRR